MKRLLFITWSMSYGYGTEKSLADIINRIDTNKYIIDVLPLFKNSETNILNDKINILDSLIDYTSKKFNEKKALDYYYYLLANPIKFNRLIKNKYDCVIACNHNAPSYFASYIKNTPKVVWVRGDLSELDYTKFNVDSKEYNVVKQEFEMQKNVFNEFDSIVVISESVRKALYNLFGIFENVIKIPNSVDTQKILQMSEEKVPGFDKATFVTLGRLDDNKNQILLLKACKLLKEKTNDFNVYLLGEGENRKILQNYIDENLLCDNVKILGFIDNPYPYVKNSVASVLTSLSEGFSLALAESVILNTPIISTDVGIAKELVDKHDCGNIIDYNESNLANVMFDYVLNYRNKKNIDVGNEFDVDSEVSNTLAIIESVINENNLKSKFQVLPYPVVSIDYSELGSYVVKSDCMYILSVSKENVKYEYLINFKSNNNKLVVFNNGAVAGGNVSVPVFQRHSWANILKASSIFVMDPTLYVGDLSIGWGIGKNVNYYLENSSLILKTLINKMNIKLKDTIIYGTSAGGFLSIIMGIYLKGSQVVADNTQLDVTNWAFVEAVDNVIELCFDNVAMALKYPERFNVVDAFIKNNYVPKIYLHVNVCSNVDNEMQLVPFLQKLENMKNVDNYNDIEVFLHYEPLKGHDGLRQYEALNFIYNLLNIEN